MEEQKKDVYFVGVNWGGEFSKFLMRYSSREETNDGLKTILNVTFLKDTYLFVAEDSDGSENRAEYYIFVCPQSGIENHMNDDIHGKRASTGYQAYTEGELESESVWFGYGKEEVENKKEELKKNRVDISKYIVLQAIKYNIKIEI